MAPLISCIAFSSLLAVNGLLPSWHALPHYNNRIIDNHTNKKQV
jgi:hypothetical protein